MHACGSSPSPCCSPLLWGENWANCIGVANSGHPVNWQVADVQPSFVGRRHRRGAWSLLVAAAAIHRSRRRTTNWTTCKAAPGIIKKCQPSNERASDDTLVGCRMSADYASSRRPSRPPEGIPSQTQRKTGCAEQQNIPGLLPFVRKACVSCLPCWSS